MPATHLLPFPPPSSCSRCFGVGREYTGLRNPKHTKSEIRNPPWLPLEARKVIILDRGLLRLH